MTRGTLLTCGQEPTSETNSEPSESSPLPLVLFRQYLLLILTYNLTFFQASGFPSRIFRLKSCVYHFDECCTSRPTCHRFCHPNTEKKQIPVAERSTATRLLGFWVRIPLGAWMSVFCECCVSSGRDLCDGPIPRPGESYRPWRVPASDQETSNVRRSWPALGCQPETDNIQKKLRITQQLL